MTLNIIAEIRTPIKIRREKKRKRKRKKTKIKRKRRRTAISFQPGRDTGRKR